MSADMNAYDDVHRNALMERGAYFLMTYKKENNLPRYKPTQKEIESFLYQKLPGWEGASDQTKYQKIKSAKENLEGFVTKQNPLVVDDYQFYYTKLLATREYDLRSKDLKSFGDTMNDLHLFAAILFFFPLIIGILSARVAARSPEASKSNLIRTLTLSFSFPLIFFAGYGIWLVVKSGYFNWSAALWMAWKAVLLYGMLWAIIGLVIYGLTRVITGLFQPSKNQALP